MIYLHLARALRLEHILLDGDENIQITSWTRAVITIDPVSGLPSDQPKEPKARRKNHLPPEVFQGKYKPLGVDIWSLGVCLAVVVTKHFPFNPDNKTISFENQWTQFCSDHKNLLREDILQILNLIFRFNQNDKYIYQAEMFELLNAIALETETDELATEDVADLRSTDFFDVIEDTKS